MKNQLHFKLCLFIVLSFLSFTYCQTETDPEPGVDRWKIKVSATNFKSNDNAKPVPLKKLLKLPLLQKAYNSNDYADVLIPKKVRTLQEGDIISTKGYLHLVALEKSSDDQRDGDYHLQLTLSSQWGDSCFIVEIPYADFVSDPELKSLCKKNRGFIRKELLKNENKEPSTSGNVIQHPVYVKVTGQLFYDAAHAGQMRNPDKAKRQYRGKKGNSKTPMYSYTAWEIHPVTDIQFASKSQ